jgi:hypothetical protein
MARKRKKGWNEATATKTAARKAHFANGGSLATWRGRPATFADRKARANKRACRRRIQEG